MLTWEIHTLWMLLSSWTRCHLCVHLGTFVRQNNNIDKLHLPFFLVQEGLEPMTYAVLHRSPLKILRSRVFHLYSSLILIGLLGNFWLETVFVLEWPILKCLHTIKECQVAYAKTYLNMQCNGKFGCALRNITSNVSVVKYWASWSFPDKNPPSRKEIISNFQWGDYCIGLWWILFDPKRNA